MLSKLSYCLKIIYKYSKVSALLYVFFTVLIAILPAMILLVIEKLIDAIIYNSSNHLNIILWISVLFVSLLSTAIFAHITTLQKIRINKNLSLRFSRLYYTHLDSLDYACFENADSQNTIARLGNSLYEKFVNLYEVFCVTLSSLLGVITYVSLFIQASLWVLAVFPFVAISIYLIDSKNLRLMKQLQDRQSLDERLASYLEKLCINKHALFELKIFGAAQYIIGLFSSKSKKLHKELQSKYIHLQRNLFLGTLIAIIWIALIVYFLCDAIINKRITIGLFASLIGGAYSLISSIQSFSYLSSVLAQESVIVEHYQKFLSFKKRDKSEITINNLAIIEFRNVFFSYPNTNSLVLNNISFIINPAMTTALVGKNGSGKSTIIKLLLRLYSPTSGHIFINDTDIQNIRTEDLHKLFSVAFQDFSQYCLTLEENLTLGNSKIAENKLGEIADNFFHGQELNLDTLLGKYSDNGRDLSLGQWQRLVLARLSLSSSEYLIMDEPTASLDPIAESNLYTSMQSLLKKRGALVISHRLASSKMANTILVIDNGQLVQQGIHDELVIIPGLYSEMWQLQSSWYVEDAI